VIIRGDGVAAYCCAYLLTKAGLAVDLQPADRPRLPVILLGEQALGLIRDIFDQPALFDNLPRIRRRVVAWGPGAKPIDVEHSAVVVSEALLLESIRPRHSDQTETKASCWEIYAAPPLPSAVVQHRFGSRTACASPVNLKEGSDSAACWIESIEDGWLFLVSGWLLAVGAPAETLLAKSKVVAREVSGVAGRAGEFPAYARIASPLCAPGGWLACGTAAMAFDPICGDGTAHAIREAILASAVIRALADGGSPDDLLAHYEARLTAGFRRHLMHCRQFYLSGGAGALWRSELEAIDRGIQWSDAKLGAHAIFRYQLRGFELEAVR
jgi:hypothetical protein